MRRLLPWLGLLVAGTSAEAALIAPVSVTGSGPFAHSADLIIDGVLPPRSTLFDDASNVWWYGTAPSFTIDLGELYTIGNLTAYVDNNDDYLIEYSEDGIAFASLFQFVIEDGLPPFYPGIEILTTDSGYPSLPDDLSVPAYVGRTFLPVDARFLRISAIAGDDYYAIGELQAFGVRAVPEPSTILSVSLAAVLVAAAARRRHGNGSGA